MVPLILIHSVFGSSFLGAVLDLFKSIRGRVRGIASRASKLSLRWLLSETCTQREQENDPSQGKLPLRR
ncbi:hypothetical protein K470DRAFT_256785 [Piedraia hortae CBS 480.64]|uniref:Uncharacterized protein n=1 Tax=Piedraia hortae CBS 480.64 TaxID=1314780 RepID=A0A6A7C247_9PEZI|nr:hypothetical protein K470DRAFT_256785 [Piedraia hortae CBS 480.64]